MIGFRAERRKTSVAAGFDAGWTYEESIDELDRHIKRGDPIGRDPGVAAAP